MGTLLLIGLENRLTHEAKQGLTTLALHRVALKPFFVYALAVRALRKRCLDVIFCLLDVGIASVIIRQVQMTGIKKLIWKLYRFFSCYRGPAFLTFLKVIVRVLSVEYFETSPTKVSMTLVAGHFVATVKLLNRRGTWRTLLAAHFEVQKGTLLENCLLILHLFFTFQMRIAILFYWLGC